MRGEFLEHVGTDTFNKYVPTRRNTHCFHQLREYKGFDEAASRLEQILDNLHHNVGAAVRELEEMRATDDSGMNALHWAAGQEADGSVQAAKAVLEKERALASRCFPDEYNGRYGEELVFNPLVAVQTYTFEVASRFFDF